MTFQTKLAEAAIRAEADSPTPCPERLAVLADEYIAAQLTAARAQRRTQLRRARAGARRGRLAGDD